MDFALYWLYVAHYAGGRVGRGATCADWRPVHPCLFGRPCSAAWCWQSGLGAGDGDWRAQSCFSSAPRSWRFGAGSWAKARGDRWAEARGSGCLLAPPCLDGLVVLGGWVHAVRL